MRKKLFAFTLVIFLLFTGSVHGEELKLKDIEDLMKAIQNDYYFQTSKQELLEGALRGIFYPLDPFSQYFSKEEMDIFKEKIDGSQEAEARVTYQILEKQLGYLKIPFFAENMSDEVEKALQVFKKEKVKGIILDLRNNPGGLLEEAVNIADFFIPKGPVVHIEYKNGDKMTYSAIKDPIKLPLVVLVNGRSASASEVLGAAIQETMSGKIVGTTTYGKGTVQGVERLSNGGGFKLTFARYLTPKGNWLYGKGITPDILVENSTEEMILPEFAPMIEEKVYGKGEKGLNIYGAQQRLKYLGYGEIKATGILEENMEKALKDFQKANGLKEQNGTLDIVTRDTLNNKVAQRYNSLRGDLQLQKAIEILSQ